MEAYKVWHKVTDYPIKSLPVSLFLILTFSSNGARHQTPRCNHKTPWMPYKIFCPL